ncbi:MAG: polymer-forming cytoskeletal protein [Alphaproteobacteria bacterium]|nr:polymer-forming cytoskeletal protein [Alphaproteobacteria bacterium]
MARSTWWPARRSDAGNVKPRRARRRAKVYLGPDIVLSGDIKSCHTVVAEGAVESNRIECRVFVLGNTGSFKGTVEAESAVISGRFEGRLTVQGRLVVKAGGQVRGTVHYGQLAIEPGGEVQGDIVVGGEAKAAGDEELDILDIAVAPKAGRPIGNAVSPAPKAPLAMRNGASDPALEAAAAPELAHP